MLTHTPQTARDTKNSARGFTLIEMLVSTAIFIFVMVMALGALLAMSEADRRAEVLNTAENDLSFVLDDMTRTIRTGSQYSCGSTGGPNDCYATPASNFSFVASTNSLTGCPTNGNPCTVEYCLSTDGTSCYTSSVNCPTSSCRVARSVNGGAWLPLTAADVGITRLEFYVYGSGVGSADSIQPNVWILVNGTASTSPTQATAFNLQTSVTQLLYDK